MTARPAESLHLSSSSAPYALSTINTADSITYLARLGLELSLIDQPPSLKLLSQVYLAHQLKVPYDTSALHVRMEDWRGPSKSIVLGRGEGMKLGRGNFERITRNNTGGHCIALQTCFASLLRALGFGVSDLSARLYNFRGQDPSQAGWEWSALVHHVLLVDWPDSRGKRYLVDVGFGGSGCPYPVLLEDGATSASVSRTESFSVKEEKLPVMGDHHRDAPQGWTLYRRVLPRGEFVASAESAGDGPGYWSPCYHFTLSTMSPEDIIILNHYNETHPDAPWMQAFCVSQRLSHGPTRTLMYVEQMCRAKSEEEGRPMAKLWTKEGTKGAEEEVQWLPFETGPVREVLEREFGFKL